MVRQLASNDDGWERDWIQKGFHEPSRPRFFINLWFLVYDFNPFWRKILYWFILLVIGKIFFIKTKCYPWWNSFPNFEFEFIWHKWPLVKCLLQILTKFNSTAADWQKRIFILMNSVQMSVWHIYVDHLKCRKTFLIGWMEGYPKSILKNGGEFLPVTNVTVTFSVSSILLWS